MAVVGFDVGNLNCYVVVARAGGIETVANAQSDRCTPAIVSFSNLKRFVGIAAKDQLVTNLRNTITQFKRLLGRPYSDPIVQHEIQSLPYQVVQLDNDKIGIKVSYLNEDTVFLPEQLMAVLLSELKNTAEINLGTKVTDCVISVPSYFTDVQKRYFLIAAEIVGLNCLKLMHDTSAVALNYGLYKQDLPGPEEKPRHVAFVDVGHSSVQVCICAFNKGKIKVLSVDSDPCLGGRDFDAVLQEYFGSEFLNKYKLNAKSKPKPWMKLRSESEKMKKLMSSNSTSLPLNIECFMNDVDVSSRINRTTFEELASQLFDRLRTPLANALENSGLKKEDIFAVEIVGGSTRIPAIKNVVQSVFEKEVSTTLNADEAVARGCAIQCAMLSPTFKVKDIEVLDATPYAISMMWKAQMSDEDGKMEIFNKYHSFPATKMLTLNRKEPFELRAFYSPNQTMPHPQSEIGSFLIKGVTPTSTGEVAKVKVRVRLNNHGIFTVSSATMLETLPTPPPTPDPPAESTAKASNDAEPMDTSDDAVKNENGDVKKQENAPPDAAGTKAEEKPKEEQDAGEKKQQEATTESQQPKPKKQKKPVKSTDLTVVPHVPECSPSELNKLIEKENEMVMRVRQENERADALNSVEEYVYEIRDKIYDKYEKYITEEDRQKLSKKLEDTETWLYDEGDGQQKSVYVEKLNELKKMGQPVAERYQAHTQIPSAFDALGHSLQRFMKVLNKFNEKDEAYVHLEEADMKKMKKQMDEKFKWLNEKMSNYKKQQLYENPNILPAQIHAEKKLLEDFCNPIVNKPKPKVEPPSDNGKNAKNGEKTEGTTGENPEAKQEEKGNAEDATKTTTSKTEENAEMDID